MHFINLMTVVAFGSIASVLGDKHNPQSTQGPGLESSTRTNDLTNFKGMNSIVDALKLQHAVLLERQDVPPPFTDFTKAETSVRGASRRDEITPSSIHLFDHFETSLGDLAIESFPPTTIISHPEVEGILAHKRDGNALHRYHPITVPQMQSTMAPVEAAQSLRSFKSAEASISSMSRAAAQGGRADATKAAAAAIASESLARTQKTLKNSLMKSCKGDRDCERYYKNELKSGNGKNGKQHNGGNKQSDLPIYNPRHGNGADVAMQISSVVIPLGGIVAVLLLM